MRSKDLPFWVAANDAQFWLDADRYKQYATLKKELFRLE